MRATTPLNRVLTFSGAGITNVEFCGSGPVVATVGLTARKKLSCPHCPFTTHAGHDTRWAESRWRHLDMGGTPLLD